MRVSSGRARKGRLMKQRRFTEEQIVAILKQSEAGMKTADVCRQNGESEATFYTTFDQRTPRLQVNAIGTLDATAQAEGKDRRRRKKTAGIGWNPPAVRISKTHGNAAPGRPPHQPQTFTGYTGRSDWQCASAEGDMPANGKQATRFLFCRGPISAGPWTSSVTDWRMDARFGC